MSELDFPNIPTSELWIKFHDGEGRERVESANEIARRLFDERSWIELIALSEAALEIPETQDDPYMAGRFNWNIGYSNFALNRYSDSVVSYRKAVTLYLSANAIPAALHSIRNATDGLMNERLFSQVLELCEEGLAISESEKCLDAIGDLYARKAEALEELGLLEEALHSFELARNQYQLRNDDESMVRVDKQRIEILLLNNQPNDAVEIGERLLVLANHAQDAHQAYHAVELLARSLNAANQPQQVLVLLDETEPNFNSTIRAKEKAELKAERATALMAIGEYEAAYETLREAVALAEYSNSSALQLHLLEQAYMLAANFDELQRMRSVAEEEVRVARRVGTQAAEFGARLRLVELEIMDNNFDTVAEQLQTISKLEPEDGILTPDAFATHAYCESHLSYHSQKYLQALEHAERGLFILNGAEMSRPKARLLRIRALSLLALERIDVFDLPMVHALAAAIKVELWAIAEELSGLMQPPNHLDIQMELDFL